MQDGKGDTDMGFLWTSYHVTCDYDFTCRLQQNKDTDTPFWAKMPGCPTISNPNSESDSAKANCPTRIPFLKNWWNIDNIYIYITYLIYVYIMYIHLDIISTFSKFSHVPCFLPDWAVLQGGEEAHKTEAPDGGLASRAVITCCLVGRNMFYPLANWHNHGTSSFFLGQLTISMAILNSYVKLPEGICSYTGNIIIPPDEVIFFRGVGIPSTSLLLLSLFPGEPISTSYDLALTPEVIKRQGLAKCSLSPSQDCLVG